MKKDYTLEKRKTVIAGFIIFIVTVYIMRLFYLQIIETKYKASAESNAFLKETIYPSRGLIYDRKGELLVFNQPSYDIMVISRNVENLDTVDFCRTMDMTVDEFKQRFADIRDRSKNPSYSAYSPQIFLSQLSQADYGRIQEKIFRYKGFFAQKRIIRQYAKPIASNILGNIREVNNTDIERDDYYQRGDATGDLGVESSYEKVLRGEKGVKVQMRDMHGKIIGSYDHGSLDVAPIAGKDLTLSIDAELQEFGERLMRGKIGAIVAIEPSTGEILCMVSSPTYDPNLLVGKERGKNYSALVRNPLKPLYDRALQGAYPPGSTFKPTQGLIFLQENIITPGTMFPCSHGYVNSGLRVGCHSHGSPLALEPALQTSCNAYFCWGLKAMFDGHRSKYGSIENAFEVWKKHMVSMGYGYKLGIDLPSERRGFLPNSKWYSEKVFKKRPWSANSVISIAIGQGEILATPLQIANLAATIANRGYFYTPHIVKDIKGDTIEHRFHERHYTTINSRYYTPIVNGMRMAVTGGTCRTANLPEVEVCGKTGTAQNPHGKDHSAFIGFAPMNNPKIAVCVYVENAGFGAAFGVPIGSLIIEKYLFGKISPSREHLVERMVNSNTIIYSGVSKH